MFENDITQNRSAWKRYGEVETVRAVNSTEMQESSVHWNLPEVDLDLKKFFGVKLRMIIMQENCALWEELRSMMHVLCSHALNSHSEKLLKIQVNHNSIFFFLWNCFKIHITICNCILLWPSGSHKALETALDFDIEAYDACLGWCVSKLCLLVSEEKNLTHFYLRDCIPKMSHRPIVDLSRKCGNSKAEEGYGNTKLQKNPKLPKKASVCSLWIDRWNTFVTAEHAMCSAVT